MLVLRVLETRQRREKEAAHRSGVHSHRPESAIASLPPELPSVNALLYTGESLAPLKSLSKAFLK